MIRLVVMPILLLVVSFLAVAWFFLHYLDELALGISVWSLFALNGVNLPAEKRHLQWALPPAALIWTLVCLALLLWLKGHYQEFVANHGQLFDWLDQYLSLRPPPDIAQAILWLNALLLCPFVFAKSLYMAGLRLAGAPQSNRASRWSLAYRKLPAQDWTLIPWWLFTRWLAWGAALVGLIALATCWLLLNGTIDGVWLPFLPAALTLVGMELAAWLGGPVVGPWRPQLEGEDAISNLHGQFSATWKSYRETWPSKWLVAGNLAPRQPGDQGKQEKPS